LHKIIDSRLLGFFHDDADYEPAMTLRLALRLNPTMAVTATNPAPKSAARATAPLSLCAATLDPDQAPCDRKGVGCLPHADGQRDPCNAKTAMPPDLRQKGRSRPPCRCVAGHPLLRREILARHNAESARKHSP
jgi:hypothetical protein